jgi:hypothetical protein
MARVMLEDWIATARVIFDVRLPTREIFVWTE